MFVSLKIAKLEDWSTKVIFFRRVDKMDEMEVDEIGEFSKNSSQASLLVAFYPRHHDWEWAVLAFGVD